MTHRTFENPNSIEARQHLLDNRCERTHPKRHRTRKRSKRLAAKRKAAIKVTLATKAAKSHRFHAAVRAYWSGSREVHP